jgi:hypothetical protein
MQKATDNLEESYSEVNKSFGDFKNSMGDAVRSALCGFSSDEVKQFTSKLVDEMGDFVQSGKESVAGVKNKCKNQIKENPFTVVLGSLVIGALIGGLLRK